MLFQRKCLYQVKVMLYVEKSRSKEEYITESVHHWMKSLFIFSFCYNEIFLNESQLWPNNLSLILSSIFRYYKCSQGIIRILKPHHGGVGLWFFSKHPANDIQLLKEIFPLFIHLLFLKNYKVLLSSLI